MTNLTLNSFFVYVYFISLHVSSIQVLIIRRFNCINTISGICHSMYGMQVWTERPNLHIIHSDIYQISYWYNLISWWWALECSKHVEKWNKRIQKRNWASSRSLNITLFSFFPRFFPHILILVSSCSLPARPDTALCQALERQLKSLSKCKGCVWLYGRKVSHCAARSVEVKQTKLTQFVRLELAFSRIPRIDLTSASSRY